jgi:hypothetical protein
MGRWADYRFVLIQYTNSNFLLVLVDLALMEVESSDQSR